MRYGADAEAPDGNGMRMGAALAVHYPLGPVVANAGYTQRGITATDGDVTWALDYLTFGFSYPYSVNDQILVSGKVIRDRLQLAGIRRGERLSAF